MATAKKGAKKGATAADKAFLKRFAEQHPQLMIRELKRRFGADFVDGVYVETKKPAAKKGAARKPAAKRAASKPVKGGITVKGVTVTVAKKRARKPSDKCKTVQVTKGKKVFVCPS